MAGATVRRWCGGCDGEHPEGNLHHVVEVLQPAEHSDGSMIAPRVGLCGRWRELFTSGRGGPQWARPKS